MQAQPVAKNPVLFQLSTGLYLGLVCYNPFYESLQFVLEKRDFFEVEWPALMITQEKGLFPVLLGLPYITVQRSQLLWYTTHIPAELLKTYQAYLPLTGEAVPPASTQTKNLKKKTSISKSSDIEESKVIPLHPRKGKEDAPESS